MRVANKNASQYVDELKTFQGSNTFAEEHTDKLYVVYSYGYHFPMYIYDKQAGMWVGNEESYSVSTSKHQNQCRPSESVECWLHTNEMKEFIRCGGMVEYMICNANQDVAFLNND